MDDRHMTQMSEHRVILDGGLDRVVRVHSEDADSDLLLQGQGIEPLRQSGLVTHVAHPDWFTRREIADNGDVLLGSLVAATQVLLIDPDLTQGHRKYGISTVCRRGHGR
jgi:hypothetical protein